MRFRRSGVNWEGRHFQTSPSLNALMDEIEAAYPDPGPGDGTVASQAHDAASSNSDHRPYPHNGPGVVNAVDAGETVEDQGIELAEAILASRDDRVRYVIHEGRWFFGHTYSEPWEWKPYTGTTNPHENHVHVSVLRENQSDGRPWDLHLGEEMVTRDSKADNGLDSLKSIFDQAKALGLATDDTQPGGVTFNDEYLAILKRAGVFDLKALAARVAALERRANGGLSEADVLAIINDRTQVHAE